jgi:hypothetical protein
MCSFLSLLTWTIPLHVSKSFSFTFLCPYTEKIENIDFIRASTAKILAGEVHTGEVHTGEVHTGEAHTGEAYTGEAYTGEAYIREVYTGPVS